MFKDEELGEEFINSFIKNYDSKYRNNFNNEIKEIKKFTHLCQFNCYNDKSEINNLSNSEICARNCFNPLFFAKRNISYLMEKVKDNFEKCKFESNQIQGSNNKTKALKKCFLEYDEEMLSIKEEVGYIYNGYLKNFNEIINKKDDILLGKFKK